MRSLSARRAWIEINVPIDLLAPRLVALRKESVDRNLICLQILALLLWSLSARRAWIEIIEEISKYVVKGRSPQGERG